MVLFVYVTLLADVCDPRWLIVPEITSQTSILYLTIFQVLYYTSTYWYCCNCVSFSIATSFLLSLFFFFFRSPFRFSSLSMLRSFYASSFYSSSSISRCHSHFLYLFSPLCFPFHFLSFSTLFLSSRSLTLLSWRAPVLPFHRIGETRACSGNRKNQTLLYHWMWFTHPTTPTRDPCPWDSPRGIYVVTTGVCGWQF